MGVFRGEKVGLVGPNGSGKSTIFRMIVGEEPPDSGQVAVERGVAIGYFSQDVGEMSGRTVLEETMAGAERGLGRGPRAARSPSMRWPTPRGPTSSRPSSSASGTPRPASTSWEATRSSRAPRRDPRRSRVSLDDVVDGDVGKLSGGWKMRVGLARILPDAAPTRCCSTSRPTVLDIESIIWLEALPARFPGRARDDLARSRLPQPAGDQDRRDRRRRPHYLLGRLRLLRPAARDRGRRSEGGPVRPPAGHARQARRPSSTASRRGRATRPRCSRA